MSPKSPAGEPLRTTEKEEPLGELELGQAIEPRTTAANGSSFYCKLV